MGWRERLARFMYGRYGTDPLYRALLVLYLVLFFIGLFVRFWWYSLLLWAVLLWTLYRVFSRNIARRQAENDWYLRKRDALQRKVRLWRRRFAERRTHAYRTCPYCHAVVRLARVKGGHTCTCPRCRKDFRVRML